MSIELLDTYVAPNQLIPASLLGAVEEKVYGDMLGTGVEGASSFIAPLLLERGLGLKFLEIEERVGNKIEAVSPYLDDCEDVPTANALFGDQIARYTVALAIVSTLQNVAEYGQLRVGNEHIALADPEAANEQITTEIHKHRRGREIPHYVLDLVSCLEEPAIEGAQLLHTLGSAVMAGTAVHWRQGQRELFENLAYINSYGDYDPADNVLAAFRSAGIGEDSLSTVDFEDVNASMQVPYGQKIDTDGKVTLIPRTVAYLGERDLFKLVISAIPKSQQGLFADAIKGVIAECDPTQEITTLRDSKFGFTLGDLYFTVDEVYKKDGRYRFGISAVKLFDERMAHVNGYVEDSL